MNEQRNKSAGATTPWYADFRLYLLVFAVLALFMLKAVFGGGYGCGKSVTGKNSVAPDFQVTGLDGAKLSLADLKGKVVFLNFWATWCKPCVQELPSIQDLAKKFDGNPDFRVVAVSCDESETKEVKKFVEDFNKSRAVEPLTFSIFHDPSQKTALAYQITGFPTTYLIDRRGIIRQGFIGPRNWDDKHFYSMVNELLAEKPAD
ncbi:MAG: TlpA family protein disulfide reductase [Myxococcales bacterium]|nr:TlpA family protein disulfide reductase [Myxococcales bacterium]